jgi:putative photosynthetic complex assembly protein 2
MNLLFPFSVTLGTVLTVVLVQKAIQANPHMPSAAGYFLLATLAGLAVIEHWFMMLPVRAEALWSWSLRQAHGRDHARPETNHQSLVQQSSLKPRA